MKSKLSFFLGVLFFIFASSCSDNNNKGENIPHDPNKAITFTNFLPDSGRIAEKMIIRGDNFGNDKSKVNVSFKDENDKVIQSAVIGVDNNTIHCIVPRQEDGKNDVIIEIDGQSVVADKQFRYSISENVSTIAGNINETEDVDGNLSDARFRTMFGIVVLDSETALVGQAWDGSGVKLVSIADNQVVTVQPGIAVGKFAATKDKSKVYGITIPRPHTIYVYEKQAAWSPSRIGEVGSEHSPGDIWSCALDDDEEWLYYLGQNGDFRRINLSDPSVNEMIKQGCIDNATPISYLAYSQKEDCFYATIMEKSKIFRISKDGTATQINSITIPGYADGYLSDATFEKMGGLTFDDEGNIYFVQCDTRIIRKISLNDGYVKTVAGTPKQGGGDDGSPNRATFSKLMDISHDGEGGFWVVSAWEAGCVIRKYAVE